VWWPDDFRNERNRGFQEMKMKFLGPILAGLMLIGGTAQAAVLNVTGGTSTTIGAASTSGFDLGGTTGLNAASAITLFNSGTLGSFGLSVLPGANVTFEYLGKEAGFVNTFTAGANTFKTDGTTALNSTFSGNFASGPLGFAFTSSGGGSAANGGPISANLAYAVAALSANSVIVLFDDGGAGTDFDDMAVKVSVSAVPLPAAAWLLISAVLGLVSFSRIRRNGPQTV
jgi:hypothetical protein